MLVGLYYYQNLRATIMRVAMVIAIMMMIMMAMVLGIIQAEKTIHDDVNHDNGGD